ncbi:immunoglobulin V-set domain protein [Cooperia oncophora]
MKIENIDLDVSHSSHELVSGISLSLSCDEAQRKTWQNETDSTISWYVNNEEIKNQRFDWRVTISAEGILNIWPLMEEDAGHYECAVDGGIMGSALINVISKSDAVMNGLYNYFYVALFYIPVAVYAIILVSRDLTKPPRKSKREDKMAAFLEEHVLKNGQDVKENIAKIIYGDQFEERKEEITKTMAAGVAPNGIF